MDLDSASPPDLGTSCPQIWRTRFADSRRGQEVRGGISAHSRYLGGLRGGIFFLRDANFSPAWGSVVAPRWCHKGVHPLGWLCWPFSGAVWGAGAAAWGQAAEGPLRRFPGWPALSLPGSGLGGGIAADAFGCPSPADTPRGASREPTSGTAVGRCKAWWAPMLLTCDHGTLNPKNTPGKGVGGPTLESRHFQICEFSGGPFGACFPKVCYKC